MFLFPFRRIPVDSNLIVYGAGNMGGQYIKQIQMTKWCNIVSVVDQNLNGKEIHGYQVSAPEAISYDAADAIVIAVEDGETAGIIKDNLLKLGADNVIWQVMHFDGGCDNDHSLEYISYTMKDGDKYAPKLECGQQKALCNLLSQMKIKTYQGINLIRVGGDADGGYVMDEIKRGKIAYSLGIGNEISWDYDMASRGFDVFMYDYSIEELPQKNERFHFFRKGITGTETNDSLFLTLDEIIGMNGHSQEEQMILKIDIEGAEWGVLENIDEAILQHFDQVVMEIHGLLKMDKWGYYADCLSRLSVTHDLIHVHGNNVSRYSLIDGLRLPDCMELTYVLRETKKFSYSKALLPSFWDRPNIRGLDEIELGKWNDKIDEIIGEYC